MTLTTIAVHLTFAQLKLSVSGRRLRGDHRRREVGSAVRRYLATQFAEDLGELTVTIPRVCGPRNIIALGLSRKMGANRDP
ncbi:hypothetical protein [Rhodococcus wratislaviensis]|uniref:hypothetical protein n=1 Tax=Rhodococcus wratislaviensis TaxID=44752 RepID=UPI003511255F